MLADWGEFSWLPQERWLRGQPACCRLLQQLPIFETAAAAEQQAAPQAGPDQAAFVCLAGTTYLAPAGTPGGALPGSFLAAASEPEQSALQLLGTKVLPLGDILR